MKRISERACKGVGRWVLFLALGGLSVLATSCNTTSVGFDYDKTLARFVVESGQEGSVVTMPVSGVRIQVNPKATLTEYDLVSVEVAEVELGKCLQFTLTHTASRIFYQASVMNQGRRLVLMVDGDAIGLRRIDGPISDGVIYIFLEIPDAELPELAKNLKGTSIEIQKQIRG